MYFGFSRDPHAEANDPTERALRPFHRSGAYAAKVSYVESSSDLPHKPVVLCLGQVLPWNADYSSWGTGEASHHNANAVF